MSRTRRVGPVEGFWTTVDEWAAEFVDPSRLHGWWASRCRLDAESGPFVDVTGEVDSTVVLPRPLREAVGARGTPVPDQPAVREALADAGVEHRLVIAARRYRWNGPALTPVAVELHTTEDEAVVEAWWEDVWASWPTIPLPGDSSDRRPPRRATATAQISKLLAALGHAPLGRLPD